MVFVINFAVLLTVKPKFHLLHHVTTCYLAHAFWYRKKVICAMSQVLCSTLDTARHDKLITTRATGTIRNLVCCVMCIKLYHHNSFQ